MTRAPLPSPLPPPESLMEGVLQAVGFGDDPETRDTPERFLEFLRTLDPHRPPPEIHTLETRSTDPIVVRDVPFHSLCAHHLLPFWGTASLGYRPGGTLVGLGGLVRLLHHHARRPQLQERLGATLADDLLSRLQARAVAVRIEARHLCMEMRGATSQGLVVTATWRGAEDPELRALLGQASAPHTIVQEHL